MVQNQLLDSMHSDDHGQVCSHQIDQCLGQGRQLTAFTLSTILIDALSTLYLSQVIMPSVNNVLSERKYQT